MRYLLDTNAVIAMLRDPASRPALRARQERVGDVAISAIVAHELVKPRDDRRMDMLGDHQRVTQVECRWVDASC